MCNQLSVVFGPVTEWEEAFHKMHKGEIVKSVLKPV